MTSIQEAVMAATQKILHRLAGEDTADASEEFDCCKHPSSAYVAHKTSATHVIRIYGLPDTWWRPVLMAANFVNVRGYSLSVATETAIAIHAISRLTGEAPTLRQLQEIADAIKRNEEDA